MHFNGLDKIFIRWPMLIFLCIFATLIFMVWAMRGGCVWANLAIQDAGIGILSWEIARDRIRITEPGKVLHGLTSCANMSYRSWLATLHVDDRESTHQSIQRALEENNSCRHEYRVVYPDGSEHWISIHGRGYFDGAGRPSKMIGVLLDVTARKSAEQNLKNQHQALAHMARVATLGELSAALVHELNQPLAAILCNAQAGQRFLGKVSPDLGEVRTILADIAMDNQRAGAVVSRLRGLFRKEGAIRQVLNINALIEEVAQLLHSELVINQVSLSLYLSAGLPEIIGDPVQVRQVLLNLIMNGIEAMAVAAPSSRQLQIRTGLQDATSLEVSIRDTGPGIVPQMRERIFESFVTDKRGGLGVGLSISRAIVNAHGGRLWADNSPEGGAVLRFTLPAFQEASP